LVGSKGYLADRGAYFANYRIFQFIFFFQLDISQGFLTQQDLYDPRIYEWSF
jgi:hypothetical protein